MVIARGRPSGIATTMTMMARMRIVTTSFRVCKNSKFWVSSRNFVNISLTVITIKTIRAANNPTFPISLAIVSSFNYSGVA